MSEVLLCGKERKDASPLGSLKVGDKDHVVRDFTTSKREPLTVVGPGEVENLIPIKVSYLRRWPTPDLYAVFY